MSMFPFPFDENDRRLIREALQSFTKAADQVTRLIQTLYTIAVVIVLFEFWNWLNG